MGRSQSKLPPEQLTKLLKDTRCKPRLFSPISFLSLQGPPAEIVSPVDKKKLHNEQVSLTNPITILLTLPIRHYPQVQALPARLSQWLDQQGTIRGHLQGVLPLDRSRRICRLSIQCI
jgi:hypothetical protein